MSLFASGVVRIITDPEVRTFETGSQVIKFYGGLNEGKDKEGEYIRNGIDVEVWNKNAQVILDYAPKGTSIFVSGNVIKEEWNDKETGAKRSRHTLKASRVELLPRSEAAPAAAATGGSDLFEGSEEIPF